MVMPAFCYVKKNNEGFLVFLEHKFGISSMLIRGLVRI